jgi:hypothetical protein
MGLGAVQPDLRDLRERVRLAELLYGRSHAGPALAELDKLKPGVGKDDPSVQSLRARVLGALGRRLDGEHEVSDPLHVVASYGPWWSIRGRWEREDGMVGDADASFAEAVATDPFDVESACETESSATDVPDDPGPETAAGALCAAARARQEPSLGAD